VQFTGEIDRQTSTWLIASKYIRYVVFGNRPDTFSYSYGFENIAGHHHYTLLNQFLCV
jgi:hypothetical protein